MRMIATPAVLIDSMKRQASRLKKTLDMPHHAALEKVARDHGYHHWHHVCVCEKATAPAEQALRVGWVFGLDRASADRYAQQARVAPLPLLEALVEWEYRRNPDPYEGAANEMAAFQQLIYFAGGDDIPVDVADARLHLAAYGVEPLALWLRGAQAERPRY